MVRVFCIIPLALAAVSAVSGHVIRRHHPRAPPNWETKILQDYKSYHERYLSWNCEKQHNTTFFDKCCHPLLKGESLSVLKNLGCEGPDDGCDDGESSVAPSSTPSTPPQPANSYTPSSASPSPSPKPESAALAKGDDTPSPSPSPQPTSSTYTPPPKSSAPPPAQTGNSNSGNGGEDHSGGVATFFYQNGVAGACGTVHQDTDFICAIDSALYNQNLCGKSVRITNTANGKTVVVTVADECPTCENADSIDLSRAAFASIADYSEGVAPIKWGFV